ncbi:hypothetical protein ACFVYJ_12360 [Pontibacter sp. JAM-7]|uniref:hypothetical protein n=1 Tax=Pontibacter sp. JAM-7 TaxID=3366581 RepID=UPI003AF6C4F7
MWQLLKTSLVFSAVFFLQNAQALTFVPQGVPGEHQVAQMLQEVIQPHVAKLPDIQQSRLSEVEIIVSHKLRLSGLALSLAEDQPQILINAEYFQGLENYIEVYLMGQVLERPHLPEQYMNYYFWHTHPVFEGPLPKSPVAWLDFQPAKPAVFKQQKAQLLADAVLDVLLHELGHHAEDAFYHYRASQYMKQEKEEEADRWAQRFRANYLHTELELGRLLSIGFIFERDRWSRLVGDGYHPRLLEWVVDNAYAQCEDAEHIDTVAFCRQLDTNVDTYSSTDKAAVAYKTRYDQGEDYASFPLALILLQEEQSAAACRNFQASLKVANVSRASYYLGLCYAEGMLEPSPPDNRVLALLAYQDAVQYGYSDAQDSLQQLR